MDKQLKARRAAAYYYGRGRRSSNARQIGLIVFSVLPLILITRRTAAPYLASASATWVVIELFVIRRSERKYVKLGTVCQEVRDLTEYQLKENPSLGELPNDEKIDYASTKCRTILKGSGRTKPVTDDASVQYAQAENARWSADLQLKFIRLMLSLAALIVAAGLLIGLIEQLQLSEYLARVLLPTIPGVLSLMNLIDRHMQSHSDWVRIGQWIESQGTPNPTVNRQTQDMIFRARSAFPLFPAKFYDWATPKLQHD